MKLYILIKKYGWHYTKACFWLTINRYSSTHRQLQQSGPNSGMQAKVDLAREEVEDAVAKVEQTRVRLQ